MQRRASEAVPEIFFWAELLSHWQPTVIKGNAGEIGALAESTEVRPVCMALGIAHSLRLRAEVSTQWVRASPILQQW